jgi:PA14 domain
MAVSLARAATGIAAGLNAEYISGDAATGEPVARQIDGDISTARVANVWHGFPPERFTIRWSGYLAVGHAGAYTFSTTSDDGSVVTIDGRTVVDNGGQHGVQTATGRIDLESGPHFILIEYSQLGGAYDMGWSWAQNGGTARPVEAWLLSPRRVPYWRALLAHTLDTVRVVVVACALAIVLWMAARHFGRRLEHGAMEQSRATAGSAGVRRIGAAAADLALFVVLAIGQTWPLASDPGHLSRNDNGDTVLNEWVLAWVAHQAPRDPLHLYDAHNFYPERDTLAYAEAMIPQSALAAPFLWLGASPVLAYNIVLIAGFALSGWTMCLVVTRWTGEWAAGLVSGILFAFNAHTLTRLPHMQAQHVEFIPLALFALDALLARPSARQAVRLALWFTLQALTSVYLLVMMTFAMAAGALARPEAWAGRRFRQIAPGVAMAGALAALALAPFMLPYWRVYHDQGMTRSIEEATFFAAAWQNYLSTPSRLHYEWMGDRWWSFSPALFPGFLGLALVTLAIARGAARDGRVRMCLAVGVAGVLLSFGGKLPGYALLYNTVPLLHSIRMTSRLGYLGIVAVAAVAGFGVAELRRLTSLRAWKAVATVLVVLAAVEPLAAPIDFVRFEGIPPIYGQVRFDPGALVVELPFHSRRNVSLNAAYLLNSTRNWRPLVNGYSGFVPLSYEQHLEQLGGFPDQKAMDALAGLGVTHVFVHLEAFSAPLRDQIDRTPLLHRVATEGSIALFVVRRPPKEPGVAP